MRSFAADPHDHAHLYLGTVTGWIYESRDGGTEWRRLAWVGKRDDLALDSIVVDSANPRHILVGAWVLGSTDGGLYVSNDGGVSWESEPAMRGESIRALRAVLSEYRLSYIEGGMDSFIHALLELVLAILVDVPGIV